MRSLLRLSRHIAQTKAFSAKRGVRTTSDPILPSVVAIEEENFLFYEPEHYYPIHIGEVYNSRYRVVGKLGYGAHSTVWLCRDLRYSENYSS